LSQILGGDRLDTAQLCAVVVTYHPDLGVPLRVAGVARQVAAVVLVDNHSSDDELGMLREVCAGSAAVDLIANPENRGVAAALNQGMAWARARGYAWALTLDQDTMPMDGLVSTLAAIHEDARPARRIAVIGSNYVDGDPREAELRAPAGAAGGQAWIETATVLTSGSAVSLRAFEAIGPFRDELFIDHVDHEYCLRARAGGFSVLLAREPLMTHSIGGVTKHRLLGQVFSTPGHPAPRWYFTTRNLIVVVRRYWRREFRWALAAVVWHMRTIVLMAAFEEGRLAKLREVLVGAWDGLRGRLGGYRGAGIPDGRASG
jgi:rhamnosyltransferase